MSREEKLQVINVIQNAKQILNVMGQCPFYNY